MNKRNPLRKQLERIHIAITVSILFVCILGFIVNDIYLSKRSITKIVDSTGQVLAQNLAAPMIFQDSKEATRTLASLGDHPVFRGGKVLDPLGHVFAFFPEILPQNEELWKSNSREISILSQGEKIGVLILYIKDEFKPESYWGYGIVLLLVVLFGLFISKVLSQSLTRSILNQFSRLVEVTKNIRSSEKFSLRVLSSDSSEMTTEEIFGLAHEFDGMIEVIAERNRRIQEINDSLEITVEERTRALKEAQVTMVQSSKMSALGEMSAGLAHEINNPLTIITGKTASLRRIIQANPVNIGQGLDAIERIEATAHRIAKIITGLRNFSRDGTGDPFEKTALKTVIDDALSFCATRFKSHNVELKIGTVSPDLEIFCRATQIGQVVLNLLNNAHDAVENLPDPWVELEVTSSPDTVEIIITDSGPGIPPAIREKIMQPFFTTKDVGKGTGLGLSISKGIIESHKGSLSIDGECKNTRFIVRLPRFQA